MTRHFSGGFHPIGPKPHPDLNLVSRPVLNLRIMYGQRRSRTRFMIDTGADLSIVSPTVTKELFGEEFEFNAVPSARRFAMAGAGPGTFDTVIQRVGLRMVDDAGEAYRFSQTILFAVPPTNPAGGMWRFPSLLGRDVLRHFELRLAYDPPRVELLLD